MRNAVHNHDFREIERTDTLYAGDVDAKLTGVGAPLMMGVDPASLAEIMLRCPSIELIKRQIILAFDELYV